LPDDAVLLAVGRAQPVESILEIAAVSQQSSGVDGVDRLGLVADIDDDGRDGAVKTSLRHQRPL
jgi:hypothetical protein